ncbi:MAG: hypothetical protein WCO94_06585 [Verrucomicrobiota bacterium]
MSRAVIGFSVFAFCLVVWAEEGLHESADQGIYSKDGLFLKVALVDDPKTFLAEWMKPSNSFPPPIKTRTSFHRGDTVFPAVMYSTHTLNSEGKADITYSLLFRRPDGSIYERLQDLPVVDGPPPKGIGLCKAKAGLKIEDTDPFGEYTLKVTITDEIRDVTVEMLFKFSVVDPNAKPELTPPPANSEPEPPEPSPTPLPTTRMRSFSDDRL